jgi:sensor c-di-GMP phosphodiesterase-like protein
MIMDDAGKRVRHTGILVHGTRYGSAATTDDFGTGYSSLKLLSKLPFTELKIDRIFIAGFPKIETHRNFGDQCAAGQETALEYYRRRD